MTVNELKIIGMLESLSRDNAVIGVKAEFETEGTRIEELRRLKEIAFRSGVSLTLKIGGASSVRDLCDARSVGVDKIVAPMVETAAALKRYLSNVSACFPQDERAVMRFLINMETITCAKNFSRMIDEASSGIFGGIVVGRTDLTGSMGLSADEVNCKEIYDITHNVALLAKSKGLDVVVGGKVTSKSVVFLKSLVDENVLDRFETRKVVFDARRALEGDLAEGIRRALEFELEWMKLKREYYHRIADEDSARIADLEKRMGM